MVKYFKEIQSKFKFKKKYVIKYFINQNFLPEMFTFKISKYKQIFNENEHQYSSFLSTHYTHLKIAKQKTILDIISLLDSDIVNNIALKLYSSILR